MFCAEAGFEDGRVVVSVALPAFLLGKFLGKMFDEPVDVGGRGI